MSVPELNETLPIDLVLSVPTAEANDVLADVAPTALLETTMLQRETAKYVTGPEGQRLTDIQEMVRDWVESDILEADPPEYGVYDSAKLTDKVARLHHFLRHNFVDIPEIELVATETFVESAFTTYQESLDGVDESDKDGSFAFVVPARMGRNHPEYGAEVEPVLPSFRYIPNELRAAMLTGVPPFVIDTYQRAPDGKRGYLVFAPVFEDMATELGSISAIRATRTIVDETVSFAHDRFGVSIVGLGATLPAYTRYGNTISNKDVITTTGHGGTVQLINKTVEQCLADGFIENNHEPLTIGVLGLGSIGASIAEIAADNFPDASLHIYDSNEAAMSRSETALNEQYEGRVTRSADIVQLIRESDVIISAITSTLSLRELGLTNTDLEGKLIVDDSQPGAFASEEVESLGGRLVWPIGKANAEGNAIRRGYDYATMVDPNADVFGCEAEAAALAAYRSDMRERGMPERAIERVLAKVALDGPVTPVKARRYKALFDRFDTTAAEAQSFGKPVMAPASKKQF